LLLAQAGCILLINKYLAFRLFEGTNPLAAWPAETATSATSAIAERAVPLDRLGPGQ
jgi:hypothetical protein